MIRGSAHLAALALSFGGCVRARDVALPAFDPATRAIIAVVTGDDQISRAGAIDPGAGPFTLSIADSAFVTLLAYPQPLRAMQLAPGTIELVDDGRPLPEADQIFRARFDPDTPPSWSPAAPPKELETIRIAPFDPVACVEGGNCVLGGFCVSSCELPEPDPPQSPDPPRFAECPETWTSRMIAHVAVCEPPADPPCPAGETRFLGDAACSKIAGRCSATTYPDDLPAGASIRYVDANAPLGGDGSFASPFDRLELAVASAIAGDLIALARGTYHFGEIIDTPIEIRGACGAETIITAASPATILVDSATVAIRRVTLQPLEVGVDVLIGGAVELEDVLIERASVASLAAGDASATLRRVVIQGRGIASTRSRIDLDQTRIEHVLGEGLVAIGRGSRNRLDRVLLRDIRRLPESGDRPALEGIGVAIRGQAELRITRSLIEDTEFSPLQVITSSATLSDVILRGSEPERNYNGITARNGADVELDRVLLERSTGRGLLAAGGRTTVRARDFVVRCIFGEDVEAGDPGNGIHLFDEASFEGERIYVHGTLGDGFRVEDQAIAGVTDLTIDSRCEEAPRAGRDGVFISTRGNVEAMRVSVTNAGRHAVNLSEDQTIVELFDLRVENAGQVALAMIGEPVTGEEPLRANIARAELRDSPSGGILVQGLVVADLREISAANQAGPLGNGFVLEDLGEATLDHVLLGGYSAGLYRAPESRAKFTRSGVTGVNVCVQSPADENLLELFEGVVFEEFQRVLQPL